MNIFVEINEKQAYGSLFSNSPLTFPSWAQGSTTPVYVYPCVRITNNSGAFNQIFSPIAAATAWAIKIALGNGYLGPIAGQFFIQSGIALTSGTVTSGKIFLIVNYVAGDDFTNIGGTNSSADVFTASGTTPTTWTNGSQLQEITENLAYNCSDADVQTALNATHFLAGGCTVTNQGTAFVIQWNTTGAQSTMIGNGGGLAPLSVVDISALLAGDTDIEAVQTMRLIQNPGAYQLLGNATAAATVGCVRSQIGGGGYNETWTITVDARAFAGVFSLVFTNAATAVQETGFLDWNCAASDMQTALVALTNIGANNITVSQTSPGVFVAMFIGSLANQAISATAFAGAAGGLQVPTGRYDNLALTSAALDLILNGASSAQIRCEIRMTPTGGVEDYYFQGPNLVISSIIPPLATSPAPVFPINPTTQIDWSTLPTSDPGANKAWLNGNLVQVGP